MEEEEGKVRHISQQEAREIDATKVAYFTLNDGTVLLVKNDDNPEPQEILQENIQMNSNEEEEKNMAEENQQLPEEQELQQNIISGQENQEQYQIQSQNENQQIVTGSENEQINYIQTQSQNAQEVQQQISNLGYNIPSDYKISLCECELKELTEDVLKRYMVKNTISAAEYRKKKNNELISDLKKLREELQKIRFNKQSGTAVSKLSKIKSLRKQIARVLTIIRENTKNEVISKLLTKEKKEVKDDKEETITTTIKNLKMKHIPLDLRPKKTRAMRRRLTKF